MLAMLIRAKNLENLEIYSNDLADGGLYKVTPTLVSNRALWQEVSSM